MKRKATKIGILLSVLVASWHLSAQVPTADMSVAERNALLGFNDTIDRLADDFVTVSLIVANPGNVLYTVFGHAALRLQCPTFDLDYVFSYEGEDVQHKIPAYLAGRLKMGVYGFQTGDFIAAYSNDHRRVEEYTLHLTPQQKLLLWEDLDRMVELGMVFRYDPFEYGCAKTIIRTIKRVAGNEGIHYAPWPDKYTSHTVRELATMEVKHAPWVLFMLYVLVGTEIDHIYPSDEQINFPANLVEVWQHATFDSGLPVLSAEPEVLAEGVPATKKADTPFWIALALLLLEVASCIGMWAYRRQSHPLPRAIQIGSLGLDYGMLAIQTLLGGLMTYLICFSDLPCTGWNWLFIPFNILPLMFWHWRRYWALPYAVVMVVWMVAMVVYPHQIVEASHLLLTAAWTVAIVKQWCTAQRV